MIQTQIFEAFVEKTIFEASVKGKNDFFTHWSNYGIDSIHEMHNVVTLKRRSLVNIRIKQNISYKLIISYA